MNFDPKNFQEAEERIKELYSIIWLLVWKADDHETKFSQEEIAELKPNGETFTTWTEIETGDFIIKAQKGETM